MAEEKLGVAVDKLIHEALKGLAQNIYALHGIRIHHAEISWLDLSTHGKVDYRALDVQVSTSVRFR